MNAYKLSVAGVNTSNGVKRFNGNAAIYEKYLKKYPEDPNYSALCSAIEAGDIPAAFAAAHTLKGTAGNLSLERLYDDICPLVEELRAGRSSNIEELLAPVTRDHLAVLAALEESI